MTWYLAAAEIDNVMLNSESNSIKSAKGIITRSIPVVRSSRKLCVKAARHGGLSGPWLWALMYSVVFLLFFSPASYAMPKFYFRLWQVGCVGICTFSTIIYLMKCRVSSAWASFAGFFFVYYTLTSLLMESDGWPISIIYNTIRGIGFASIAHYGLGRQRKSCVLGFIIGGMIMCGINYCTFLIYRDSPSGMLLNDSLQNWYFLGHDNGTFFFYLPVIAVMLIYGYSNSGLMEMAGLLCMLFTVGMYGYLRSMAALGGMTIFIVLIAYILWCSKYEKKILINFLTTKQACFIALLCSITIVILSTNQHVLGFIGELGKSHTFELRTVIWKYAIEISYQNPLFGCGFNSTSTRVQLLTFDHAHNLVLQILYQGGIFSLLWFLFLCYSNSYGPLFKLGKVDVPNAIAAASILALGVASCFDYYPEYFPQYFPLLLMGLCSASMQIDRPRSPISS